MTDEHSQSEHKDHVLPVGLYFGVGAVLFFLTLVTVAVSRVDLGALNLSVAMGIAVVKASLVALFFMHLLYDKRFYMSAMLMSLLFLGVFIIITMSDTMRRGDIYEEVRRPIVTEAKIYKNLKESGGGGHEDDGHGGTSSAEPDTLLNELEIGAPTH